MARERRNERTAPSVGQRMVGRLKRFAEALETTDSIPERFTCRTIRLNLEPMHYDPDRVRAARLSLHASQTIFAQFLGVSVAAVRDWEQGVKPPRGSSCRIMDEITRDPEYWRGRLKELATPVGSE
ncbi:MAG: transcriptional regulator [Candidatus Nealsonbacteria bacterium]|nr:transcriptional regulator [Candidatus Nealsonbacteria bacterium]